MNYSALKKVICILGLFYFTFNIYPQSTYYLKMMKACDLFVKNYRPTYIMGKDTFVVSMVTTPPVSINKFLFDCIKKRDLKPLKYSAVIFFKQHNEYWKVNRFDYFLLDGEYENNGIVEIMRYAIGFKDDIPGVYNFPYYTGDVCKWIRQNKNKINDFEYVERYLKSIH